VGNKAECTVQQRPIMLCHEEIGELTCYQSFTMESKRSNRGNNQNEIYFNLKFRKIVYGPPTGPSQSSYAPYSPGMPLRPPLSSKEEFFLPPAPEQSPPALAGSNTNGNGYVPVLSSPQQQLRQYSGSYQYPRYSAAPADSWANSGSGGTG